jgi:formate dehydrogenase maturation protein FdhE
MQIDMEKQIYLTNNSEFEYDTLKSCPFCGNKPEITIQRTDAAIRFNHEQIAKLCIDEWNKRV